jgi:hypothetical protein
VKLGSDTKRLSDCCSKKRSYTVILIDQPLLGIINDCDAAVVLIKYSIFAAYKLQRLRLSSSFSSVHC